MQIFILLTYLSFFRRNEEISKQQQKFSFIINEKQINLINPKTYLTNVNDNQKNWYYIHFIKNKISKITQFIPINTTDMIIKNTYILYLSTKQLSMISNISLAKRIEPSDKFIDSNDKLSTAKYLLIIGPSNFQISENSNLYNIKQRLTSNSYVLKITKTTIRSKVNLIEILSLNPSILRITIYHKPILQNNIMAGYTQKNTRQFHKHNATGLYYTERYLNSKGLNGEGQIVTVVDTYIDFNHAMFYDSDSEFDVKVPLNHRKFVFYNFNGTVDELKYKMMNKEHGTHVAATIAGDTQNCEDDDGSLSIFNGIAPKAKLIYFKLNSFTIELETEIMNRYHSKISSNSWDYMGFDDDGNYRYSLTAFNHPELIFIFAAGNEYQGGNFTIDDPSGSKNTLAVGSIDDFYNDKRTMRFQCVDDPSVFIDAEDIQMYDPFLTGTLGTDVNKSDIVIVNAEEPQDCQIFKNDRLFLNYASSVEKTEWIKQCYLYPSKGVFLTTDIEKVNSILEYSKSSLFTAFDITPLNNSQPVQHAYFSSGGPGNKGIIKPDVMAPGRRIFSAKSLDESPHFHGCRENGTSEVTIKEGTSQATPNVAGAAALISQYFESGNWSIKSVKNSSVVLDGSTIRALLINSCVHPHGNKTPDVLFGHGVVDLSTLLPFDDEFGLKITDQKVKPTIGQNGHLFSPVKVTSTNKKLQITLSYLDAVLAPNSPILLAHDLDLVVVSPSGKIFKGDNIENGDTQHLSTNEKVIINENELEIGEYNIHIYSGSFIDADISSKTQDFAVVATGGIESGYLTLSEAEKCTCDQCSEEIPSHCKCEDDSVGPICQGHLSIQKVNDFPVSLKAHEIARIKLVEKNLLYKINHIKSINVEAVGDAGRASVWIDKNCHLELGEFETNIGEFLWDSNLKVDVNYKSSKMCIAIFNNNFQNSSFYVTVTRQNYLLYSIVGLASLLTVLLIIIITVAVVKSRRNRERNGFTEIKSIN